MVARPRLALLATLDTCKIIIKQYYNNITDTDTDIMIQIQIYYDTGYMLVLIVTKIESHSIMLALSNSFPSASIRIYREAFHR